MPKLCVALLLAINASITWKLFFTEFTRYTSSNEGTFMAISRFLAGNGFRMDWYPFWFNGVPFENTYSPLMQLWNATLIWALHLSPALAYHATAAFFYTIAPAALFVFAWKLSGQVIPSFVAALMYSLWSPSVLIRVVRWDVGGWWHARRLHAMVQYGEVAHPISLCLLPLALLCAWMAVTRGRFRWYATTGLLMAASVLFNAFGAVDLALGLGCIVLLLERDRRLPSLLWLSITGAIAYLIICPLLTPTLIHTIQVNSQKVGGDFRFTFRTLVAWTCIVGAAAAAWFAFRRQSPVERMAWMLLAIFSGVLVSWYLFATGVLPQPPRYHLEFELAFCLAVAFTATRMLPQRAAPYAVAVFLAFTIHQWIAYKRFARRLIQPIDISQTVEYKTAKWLDANQHGLRSMVSGDLGTWFNVFTDNPQLSSGHDPFSPNWVIEDAVYAIYSGDDAGANDAHNTITWLKAFGCHSITVPGPGSREEYKPYRNPHKLDGLLPLLWRDGPDSIYDVPQRSPSIAHVVLTSETVQHVPVNGIDLVEVERYVAALEDGSLPAAHLDWENPSRARIQASVQPGQVISVQETFDPGWLAKANGRPARVHSDGIGLIVIEPDCHGECNVELSFDGGMERRLCRTASGLTLLAILAGAFVVRRRSIAATPDRAVAPSGPPPY